MVENKQEVSKDLEKALQALEQAKQRVANEKKKQNEKKRKAENHHKYIMRKMAAISMCIRPKRRPENERVIDGYTDFIFINRFGGVQHQGTLNKAIRRIIRDCNDKQLESGIKNPVLLPPFSCHSLRHTFTTRLVEANV